MPSVRRRLLPLAALLSLSSAVPAAAAEPIAFTPAITPALQAPTEAPGRTPVDGPAPLVRDAETGELTLRREPAKGRVVAGTTTDIRTVPWQVYLYTENGTTSGACGGSIISATKVITAAHCVHGLTQGAAFNKNGLAVVAGISNFVTYRPTDKPQYGEAASYVAHPGYVHGRVDLLPQGDVAVVTLKAPFDLSGDTAKAIALPPIGPASVDGEPVPVGPAVRVSGFGLQSTAADADGQLYLLDSTVVDPDFCGNFPNATGLCTMGSGTICSGDSGGGLVAGGLLVGVVSASDVQCGATQPALFTNLLAPENRLFIESPTVAPPVAPRVTSNGTASATSYQVGGVVTCSGAAFTGGASVKYVVTNDLGARLAASVGPSISYTQTAADVGRKMECRAYGSNAGGVAASGVLTFPLAVVAAPAPIVTPAPKPAVTPRPTPAPGAKPVKGLGAIKMFARAPVSARPGQRFKFTSSLEELPANVASVKFLITHVYQVGTFGPVASNSVKTVADGQTVVQRTVTTGMPRKAKRRGKYRVRVDFLVTYDDGTTAKDHGFWTIKVRR